MKTQVHTTHTMQAKPLLYTRADTQSSQLRRRFSCEGDLFCEEISWDEFCLRGQWLVEGLYLVTLSVFNWIKKTVHLVKQQLPPVFFFEMKLNDFFLLLLLIFFTINKIKVIVYEWLLMDPLLWNIDIDFVLGIIS